MDLRTVGIVGVASRSQRARAFIQSFSLRVLVNRDIVVTFCEFYFAKLSFIWVRSAELFHSACAVDTCSSASIVLSLRCAAAVALHSSDAPSAGGESLMAFRTHSHGGSRLPKSTLYGFSGCRRFFPMLMPRGLRSRHIGTPSACLPQPLRTSSAFRRLASRCPLPRLNQPT